MSNAPPSETPPLNTEEAFGPLVVRAARDYARVVGREIGKLGVQPAYLPVLLSLWEKEGRSQSELAAVADIEQPTMAATLMRMQRDGLITKEPDPDDRRACRIMLTEHARGLREPVTRAAIAVNRHSTSTLTALSTPQLLAALRQMTSALRKPLRSDVAASASNRK